MITAETLLFVQGGYRQPAPFLHIAVEHPEEVHGIELSIGGEVRRWEFSSQPRRSDTFVYVRPGAFAEAARGTISVAPRSGIVMITLGDEVVYEGPPDRALAELLATDQAMGVTTWTEAGRSWGKSRACRWALDAEVRRARRRSRRQGRGGRGR